MSNKRSSRFIIEVWCIVCLSLNDGFLKLRLVVSRNCVFVTQYLSAKNRNNKSITHGISASLKINVLCDACKKFV